MRKIGVKKFKKPRNLKKAIESYLDYCIEKDSIPTIQGFAVHAKTHSDIISRYYNEYPEYRPVINNFKEVCKEALIQKGLTGKVNTSMAMFLLRANYGFIEKQHIQSENVNIEAVKLDDESIEKVKQELKAIRTAKFNTKQEIKH